jgi:hypothetical protein
MTTIKPFLLLILLICFVKAQYGQYHVSGIICDLQTRERLIGANIIESGTSNGTSTDNSGYFSLFVKTPTIQISFIGYKQQSISFLRDTLVALYLEPGEELKEVTIVSNKANKFNVATLSSKEIKNIPTIGGKPDVIKSLLFLPGIQSNKEGSSLMNVRGGSPGENLYLIDNVPLIYVNHLGGFMSVFNPEMINNIEVYKGGFPARYGGKLSSIVNITQKEGNRYAPSGTFSIGLTDASFSVEGPFLDKKASFIVTGRKTLTESLFLLASRISDQNFNLYYGFHDLNAKFSWHPNEKNHLYFNVYHGDDYIRYWSKKNEKKEEKNGTNYKWGNWMTSLRWNSMLSPRLWSDITLSYTHYRLENSAYYYVKDDSLSLNYNNYFLSSVGDISLRSDWKYKLAKDWAIDFGVKASSNQLIPSRSELSRHKNQEEYEVIRPLQFDAYWSNRISLFNIINADIGLRLVNYRIESFTDWGLEPRLDFNFTLNQNHIINFSWQKVKQYSHLIMTSGSIFNNEAWIPADNTIKPSQSSQISLGWKGKLMRGFEIETNIYSKVLANLTSYKEGHSSLLGDNDWRSKVETEGSGTSKGIELLLKKSEGEWTGFMAYTYSQTKRQFAYINGGLAYVYEYDTPHSLSLNVNKKLSEKWNLSFSWTYHTGLPYTPVIGRQIIMKPGSTLEYIEEYIYGNRNSARMKDYHRLDLGCTYSTFSKRGNRAEWNFSVYNVYSRLNPSHYFYSYSISNFVVYNPDDYTPLKLYQTSYFPLIPSVSYKVYFEGKSKKSKK